MFNFIRLFDLSKPVKGDNPSVVKSQYFVKTMKKNKITIKNERYLESLTKHSTGMTYDKIGKSMGVGPERARQMDKKAQSMISKELESRK